MRRGTHRALLYKRPAAAAGSSWTPASISTLFWYDADDGATITGDPCTQWNDKSGNARHLTVPSGSGFDVVAAVQNGKVGLSCSSPTNKVMNTATFTQSQSLTIYFAIKMLGTINADAFLLAGDKDSTGGGVEIWARRDDTGNDPGMYAGGAAVVSIGADLVTSTPYYLTYVFNGASSIGYRNGVAGSTVSPGTGGIVDGISLGHASLNAADAYFLEVFAEANAGTNRVAAEAYLASKWGI